MKADTGDLLWQTDFPGRTAVIPTPIHQDGLVYVTAGYNAGSRQFKLGGAEPEMTHESNKMVNHHGGVILVDGKLYGHSDRGGWTCQDWKTGESLWQDRSLGKGACTYVAGHLVCIEEQKGTVVLIEASRPAGRKRAASRSPRRPRNGNRRARSGFTPWCSMAASTCATRT